jgi:hypothetical protein
MEVAESDKHSSLLITAVKGFLAEAPALFSKSSLSSNSTAKNTWKRKIKNLEKFRFKKILNFRIKQKLKPLLKRYLGVDQLPGLTNDH